ncbi:MAG: L-histidine N(alpha)-methyltransferase [Xanthobacteraceae bacterium]|nr:L-histidine N(alpha)-methyltransferase [Xanthobacteraceae bacterium]
MNIQTAIHAPAIETANEFAADVIAGLSANPKSLPPKYFYDLAGSGLFDRITRLPEYYPTRSELALLNKHAPEMVSLLPPRAALVEFGSGSSRKARILLRAAANVEAYMPIDISGDFLRQDAARLRRDFPHLAIHPVVADFTVLSEPPAEIAATPRAGFFPGSTIGNFEPHEAAAFLRRAAKILGPGSVLVVGVDLAKAPDILYHAYNDAEGVTAKFNLNLLVRVNRELGANFNLAAFEHYAFYNVDKSRVEMHLASTKRQKVRIGDVTVEFRAGETIHTENSYKYSIDSFQALAHGSGWSPIQAWTDGLFSVHALRKSDDGGRMTENGLK